ncbi:MAG TPA: metalloregulator ArsR/SmtB family transcription factor [Gaiellaceae bacterium]|nr:metalloregulator ArsR/SmtB family transcription factor [Gaiellaceae bacterium]
MRLRDPGALRALAHPARLLIVDELYQGPERTASELAKIADLSPSAMSYHLHALERWGIVVRGDARQDGRERPWRAAGRSLSWASDMSVAAAAAQDVIAGGYLEQLRELFRRWSLVEDAEPDTWREIAGLSRSFLWLTEEEAKAFSAELAETVQKYVQDRDVVEHPEGTRRVLCMLGIVPTIEGATGEH